MFSSWRLELGFRQKINFEFRMIYFGYISEEPQFRLKRTGHHVVGDEKTSVTMVLNKILWLEINANTSSNERMPARHRSL